MKNNLFIFLALIAFGSCDKITNIYPPNQYESELNMDLYPGDWGVYLSDEWPNFDTISASTVRNVLIDDFTGHNCQYCPSAADLAHQLHDQNPSRVFVSSIHAAPNGMSNFQVVNSSYPVDFTNSNGLELATFFGNQPDFGFFGNPSVGVNRVKYPGGPELFYPAGALQQQVTNVLETAPKVLIKAHVNYFAQTKGAFLHTEIDVDPSVVNEVGVITIIQQDSLIAPQNVNTVYTANYVHKDIHLGNVGNNTWGVTLADALKKDNGKYYLNYSFVLRNLITLDNANNVHDANRIHFLVYAYDKVTYEIYQVVKVKI